MRKRIICLFLITTLLLGLIPAAAVAGVYGIEYRSEDYNLAPGLTYQLNTYLNSSALRQEERILRARTNKSLIPLVISGSTIVNGGITINDAVKKATEMGYEVVAGINGDFFNSNYDPIGVMIQNGVLKTLDYGKPALGFYSDGTCVISQPNIKIEVTGQSSVTSVDSLNGVRSEGKVYLYTPDFAASTKTTKQGLHVVLSVTGSLKVGQSITGTVKAVKSGTAEHVFASGEMVLSASTEDAIARISHFKVGDRVTINVTTALAGWKDVVTAVGGLQYLVNKSEPLAIAGTERAPRSAAGLTEAGELVIYSVDGRQAGYSYGLTRAELGARMAELGCVTAIELDGGGSSAVSVRMPGSDSIGVVNSPSDGNPRKCANFLLLCNAYPKTTSASKLFANPAYINIMPGASAELTLRASDSNYHPVAVPSLTGISYEIGDEYTGSITKAPSGKPVFTALYPGMAEITFTYGTASGTSIANVVGRIDTITLTEAVTGQSMSELTLSPGASMSFNAKATLNTFPVISSTRSFIWSVEGGVGSITPDGVFTASVEIGASGRIVATGGGQTASIPVTVSDETVIVEDFESGLGVLSSGSGSLKATHTTNQNYVERGFGAAALTYSFPSVSKSVLTLSASAKISGKNIIALVTGDGSGNSIGVNVSTLTGSSVSVTLGKLDFTGSKWLIAELPPYTSRITGITVTPTGSALTGTIYLDQILSSYDAITVSQPPKIEVSRLMSPENTLYYSITATDYKGKVPSDVSIMWDGELIDGVYWDSLACQAVISLPLPVEGSHLLTVTACDIFGNITRSQTELVLSNREPALGIFDLTRDWYKGAVNFLDDKNIVDTTTEFGLRYFKPEANCTRIELFRMVYRAIVPKDNFSTVKVPFTDLNGLSDYDLEVAKAMYALGFVSGKTSSDGTLRLDPSGIITRAEVFTVLSKYLPVGYGSGDLTVFSDYRSVPAYAARGAEKLVSLGVVVGGNGKINPGATLTRAEAAILIYKLFY